MYCIGNILLEAVVSLGLEVSLSQSVSLVLAKLEKKKDFKDSNQDSQESPNYSHQDSHKGGQCFNPNYPGVFSKQFIPRGAQLSSPLNPPKIQHFNGYFKFFYRGLDMYIKG